MKEYLEKIVAKSKDLTEQGEVAAYIPELKKMNKKLLGITVKVKDGEQFSAGDYDTKFTIQSVSKPLVLIQALLDVGEERVFQKVGVEPTGDPFNSIVRLETTKEIKKPFNPMINAGAIAISGLIKGENTADKLDRVLKLIRDMAGNQSIAVNMDVYHSEHETGNKNRSMGYFLKDLGVIEADVDSVLELYFKCCSIEATTIDLANIANVIASGGLDPKTGVRYFPERIGNIINTLMVTCGMYDASGEFALNVGIPSKSGVGGGILSVVPGKMGIGVFGPALDEKGNSIAGVKMLQELSLDYCLNIF